MFLQPANIPDRCFLEEVILWVGFQRLPFEHYLTDKLEFREGQEEVGGYAPESYCSDGLDDDECARANIPPDPRRALAFEDGPFLEPDWYDEFLLKLDDDDEFRPMLEAERRKAVEHQTAVAEWMPKYERAIEYHASRIYIALLQGRVAAFGRLLPSTEVGESIKLLSEDGQDIVDLPIVGIPPAFWSLGGIHWASSAAENGKDHYCWIQCKTEDVLTEFPGDHREPVFGVERVGTTFIVPDGRPKLASGVAKRRGRPPYQWDQFHLEVSDLVMRSALPDKKESAIQYFQAWFQRAHRQTVSRSAIGEKLTPYYERFVRSSDRK